MALIVRNFKIDWTWTGDDSSLRGFSVVIAKSDDYSVIVASQEMAPTDRTCTLMGVTVDPAIQYIAGVQAHYVGKDSDWVSSTGLTVVDDGTAHISNDSITESNLVGTGKVWTATPESGATVGAEWGTNIVNQPTSLADLDPTIAAEITALQTQTDNKLAIFVQATTPSWTDANANHVGDSWYKTTDLKWYKYNGTSWAVQDSSIFNLSDLATSKTTIHYASGTSTPSTSLGVVGDFCLYKKTSTGVMTFYIKTGTTTWTAQPGSYVDGADNTATKLATAGELTLKGTLTPQDSGALKVGSITWSPTTGALNGGSGIAITEAGIIGAKSGAATFSIDASGNALFKGDITGSTITGSTLKTSTTARRLELSNSTNDLKVYNTAGAIIAKLGDAAITTVDSAVLAVDVGSTTATAYRGVSIKNAYRGLYISNCFYAIDATSTGDKCAKFKLGTNSEFSCAAVEIESVNTHATGQAHGLRVSWADNVGVVAYGGTYGGQFEGYSGGIYATGGTYGVSSSGTSYCFYARSGTATGLTGSYGPFTGSHDGVLALTDTPVPGDILVDIAILNRGTVSDVLGLNTLSSAPKQKSVFGVFVARRFPKIDATTLNEETGEEIVIEGDVSMLIDMLTAATTYDEFMAVVVKSDLPTALLERKQDPLEDSTFGPVRDYLVAMLQTHNLAVINSVGEGMINVVAEGGNIEAGDYICSSSTPGKGMKQDDDLLHNYTVAKAREDVIWTAEEIAANAVKMIACTYHCG